MIESQTNEFKRIWQDDYLKTICAFANTQGGSLYLGVDDQGEVVGVDNLNELLETLPNKVNNRLGVLIDIKAHQQQGRSYLEMTVPATYAPVSLSGKFYQRSGSNTLELNGGNLTNFLLKKYGKTWDDVAVDNFTLEDINLDTVEAFKNWARKRVPAIANERDLKSLLERLNLYDGEKLKRAAVLLFAKNPQKYFIQAHSKIGRFLSPTELITSDIIEGNLFQQLEQVIDILRAKYLKSYISYEGLNRIETLEYPYEAIREAVINALIHRDYMDTTVLQIRVYDERLVMSNGATLSPEVPIEKFNQEHTSKPFNPVIANVFYKAGFVESWGKGTNNIVQECLKMGLPEPSYEYSFHSVTLTFYKSPVKGSHTTQETTQETTVAKVIALIKANPRITRHELAQKLHKSDATVKEHLDKLKRSGKLIRVGSTKSGEWKIVREDAGNE